MANGSQEHGGHVLSGCRWVVVVRSRAAMNYQVVDGHWYSQEQGGHVLSGCRWPMVVRSRVPMYYQVVDVQW